MDLTLQGLKAATQLSEGDVVTTYGYHRIGDGGGAIYIIKRLNRPEDGGSVIQLQNDLQAHLLLPASVNYRMFGAIGDRVNNDGVQIKHAHQYANLVGVPVINLTGEYWIKDTQQIPIQTNVQWGHTKFHIDETYNKAMKFVVSSSLQPIEPVLNSEQKASFISKLMPGTMAIPELAAYKNCLVVVKDEQDRIGIRQGYEANGWARTEFFYVEEHGRIIGDIAWTFNDYTTLIAYPCDDNYLTIDGGTFYLSGNDPGIDPNQYVQNGFHISRSRTRVMNQWVGLEPGQMDTSMNARYGFYNITNAYDVLLENIRLIPWEYFRLNVSKRPVHGTYGLGGSTVLNATYRNITAEGTDIHWGIFGTNLFKNFRVDGCRLNRIDVHFHCWNLYLRDCEIGIRGFTLTGGGDLFIENTRCVGNKFIGMRGDYGGKWDGDIRIRNCQLLVVDHQEASALHFDTSDFDYKYPIVYGKSIQIENFKFNFSGVPTSQSACWIMKLPHFSKNKFGERFIFPRLLEFKNIQAEGRENGVRILRIMDASGYFVRKIGGYDGESITPNCLMRFDNIHLEKLPLQGAQSTEHLHFMLQGAHVDAETDENALYPWIEFTNCHAFFGHFFEAVADVCFSRSSINCITTTSGSTMRGKFFFDKCDFKADVADDGHNFNVLKATLGTNLTNCTILTPLVDGDRRPDLVDRYDLLVFNESVIYNHVNTKLGKGIMDHYVNKGIAMKAEFDSMLRSSSDFFWK